MDTVLHPLLVRVRSLRAFIAASLRKMLRMEAHDGLAAISHCAEAGLCAGQVGRAVMNG
jgi:hypothetical protein